MTHEYTVLVAGTVLAGRGRPPATAIAWAADTILAIGSDTDVRAISRGDSHVVELDGAFVIPLGPGEPAWPSGAVLEAGGSADLVVLGRDPRAAQDPRAEPRAPLRPLAIVRQGRVVDGFLGGHDATRHPGSAPPAGSPR